MKKIQLVGLVLLCWVVGANAQLVPFSSITSSPFLVNSSLAGLHSGAKAHVGYHQNWWSSSLMHTNFTGAFETLLPVEHDNKGKTAVALSIRNESFGEGNSDPTFKLFSIGGAFAYHGKISENGDKKRYINGGIGLNGMQYSLDWDNLVFSDQLHPIFGQNASLPSSSYKPYEQNYWSATIEGGVSFSAHNWLQVFNLAKSNYVEMGLALSNASHNRLSIYNYEGHRATTWTGHTRVELSSARNQAAVDNRFISIVKVSYNKWDGAYGNINALMVYGKLLGGLGLGTTLIDNEFGQNISRLSGTFGLLLFKEFKFPCLMTYNYHTSLNGVTNNRMGSNHEISLMWKLGEEASNKSVEVRDNVFF